MILPNAPNFAPAFALNSCFSARLENFREKEKRRDARCL